MLKTIKKIRSYRKSKIIFFILGDSFFIIFSIWFSFLLRFDGNIPQQYFTTIKELSLLSVLFFVPLFYYQNLYSFTWSYASAQEFISLIKALVIGFIFIFIVVFASQKFPLFVGFPRSVLFIDFLLIFALCGALRFSKRLYLQIAGVKNKPTKDRTLIIGASDSGEQILRSILSSKNSPYMPVGFIDESNVRQGVSIHGVKVLGTLEDLNEVIQRNRIKQVIIAFSSKSGSELIKKAVDKSRNAGIYKIKIAPPLFDIIGGHVSFKNLKDVDIEDLLGRNPVSLDKKLIGSLIKDKFILVTGASGSIGEELCRQIVKFDPSFLLLLDQDETGIFNISQELKNNFSNLKFESIVIDVRDEEGIKTIFKKYKPEIVFHAAAYKHVPLMEKNPVEAVKNNILGTEILARVSFENNIEKFIFISTDKAVNPTSVMGATKRFGEMICTAYNQKGNTKFISVRFGNVLNSRGSVIPIFKEQIKRGGPVEVTDIEMKRYFMLISEACLLVMQAGAMGNGGEVFVLNMGKPVKIIDLARDMIKLSGFEPDKDIAITFIGIRPGEKLFEEMLTAEEGTIATENQNVFMAKLSDYSLSNLSKDLNEIKNVIIDNDEERMISLLKKIVPFYK